MKANDQYGQFTTPAEVRLVRTLPGPIERVWEYLTDPEKRARWLAAGPMEPRKGGKVRLKFQHSQLAPDETPPAEHKPCHDQGEFMDSIVTRWEPPRVLAYTFGDSGASEVTFELTPQGESVLLVLTHRASGTDVAAISGYAAGWHTHVDLLIAQLEGAPRPPFWPRWAKLKAEYAKLAGAK